MARVWLGASYKIQTNSLLLLWLLQVVVRSLAEANRTDLLNSNLTVVVPAPLPLQAEASGQQYNTSGEQHNVLLWHLQGPAFGICL